jgi:hypothetical protein
MVKLKNVIRAAVAASLFVGGAALAQSGPETHAGWGGSYRPLSHFPPPPPLVLPTYQLDTGHAGYGGSAPTPEQYRTRAARASWESISFARSRMTTTTTMPARFPGGNDGFLATVAWELGRPGNASAFQSAYGRADRGVTLYFNYNGNAMQLFIPGNQLQQAVDALRDASGGSLPTGYRFYEPPHVPPQIGAPRQAPLMLRLFGPQNGTSTGLFWTALDMANTVNPNATLSPESGWIAPGRRSSLAPPSGGPGGWNGGRNDPSVVVMACPSCTTGGGHPMGPAGFNRHSL